MKPLGDTEGHWLAGFVEAEGSFAIHPNNAGQTWTCGFSLSQRDDERDLLAGLQDRLGLGVLRPMPAVGGAHPQIVWSVVRKRECVELVEILERFPLRGRKRKEFVLWAEAVRHWLHITPGRGDRWHRIAALSRRLAAVRRYLPPDDESQVTTYSDPGFRWFVGGFATGEGSFSLLLREPPRFTVKLRRDDRPLLESIAASTGLGYLRDGRACGTSRPTSSWIVLRHRELSRLSAYLAGTLRGRRVRELEAWAVAADEFRRAASDRRHDVLAEAHRQFVQARAYRPPAETGTRRVGPTHEEIILAALRSWADVHDGPLSCTAYDAWRSNTELPARDTVARAFGSWVDALTAAGLENRVASARRARTGRAAERGRARMEAKLARRRTRAVAGVRALARERGRPPRASEYFAWRLEHHRDLPCQAATYRAFPGGWREVLATAGLKA